MDISIPSLLRIKPNALFKLGKYLRKNGFGRVALFYGEGMAELVGQQVQISLDSSEILVRAEHTVSGNDVEDVVALAFGLPPGVDAVVAVGGGVAVDVGKYVGFLTRLPVIAVPTVVSNDGFNAPGASLRVGGRRVSCTAAMPFGVVIDTSLIRSAPARFTYSGIGDLAAKFSSVADWKRSYHAVGESINDFSVMITLQSVHNVVDHPRHDAGDLEFLQLLCGALVMSGVAMAVAGSSRPASGSEHLISHAYDGIAERPSLHGLQVGVATLGTLWLQENPALDTVRKVFEQTGFTGFLRDNPLDREAFLRAIRDAPGVRPGYHTVLSEPGAVDRLREFVAGDPSWGDYLR